MIGRRVGWQLMAGRAALRFLRRASERLGPQDRAELLRLLKTSRGRYGSLSTEDRAALRRLLAKARGRHTSNV